MKKLKINKKISILIFIIILLLLIAFCYIINKIYFYNTKSIYNDNNLILYRINNLYFLISNFNNISKKTQINNLNYLFLFLFENYKYLHEFYENNYKIKKKLSISQIKEKEIEKISEKNFFKKLKLIKLNDFRDFIINNGNIKIHFIPESINNNNEIIFIIKRALYERNINVVIFELKDEKIIDKINEFNNFLKIFNLLSFNKIIYKNIDLFNYKNKSKYKTLVYIPIILIFIIFGLSTLLIFTFFITFLKDIFIKEFYNNITSLIKNLILFIFFCNILHIFLKIFYKIFIFSFFNFFYKFITFENFLFLFFNLNLFNNTYLFYLLFYLYFLIFFILTNNLSINYKIFYPSFFIFILIFYFLDKNLFNLSIIRLFKNYIENIFIIRPRIKEILSFPFIIFLFLKNNIFLYKNNFSNKYILENKNTYKTIEFIFFFGQVLFFSSIINTFSHYNTNIFISNIRALIGIILGAFLGFFLFLTKIFTLKLKINFKFTSSIKLQNKKKLNTIFAIISPTKNFGDNFYRYFYKNNFSPSKYKIILLNKNKNYVFETLKNIFISNEIHFIGGIWQDKTSYFSFLFYFSILIISKLLFKKIKFISCSIENINNKFFKKLILNFPFINYVWVRDYYSYLLLKDRASKTILFYDLFDLYCSKYLNLIRLKQINSVIYKKSNIKRIFNKNIKIYVNKTIIIFFNRNYFKNILKIVKKINLKNYRLFFIVFEEKDISFLNENIYTIKNKINSSFNKFKIYNFSNITNFSLFFKIVLKNLKIKRNNKLINNKIRKYNKNKNFNFLILSYRFHASILLNKLLPVDKYGEKIFFLDDKSINYFNILLDNNFIENYYKRNYGIKKR